MAVVLLLSASYPLFLKAYGTPDMGIVLSSYIGLFLLICAQISLGIWISSLTKNQFLAFIFTMFGLFMMLVLDFISKAITTTGGQAESIIQYFGTTKHLDVFFKGLITVGDSMFFILFTAIFLFLTTVTLDSRRWK
jgi:ABC-2 type transport system permease protein